MAEDSNNAVSSSFLLDDDSRYVISLIVQGLGFILHLSSYIQSQL